MFVVAIESVKNAEKQGGCAKAYLARLVAGPCGVKREFAPKEKELNLRNRRAFKLEAEAYSVFEARRWWWTGDRYAGGTVWFGIGDDGAIWPLSRDEAMASVLQPKITTGAAAEMTPAIPRPTRIAPERVYCRPAKPRQDLIEQDGDGDDDG